MRRNSSGPGWYTEVVQRIDLTQPRLSGLMLCLTLLTGCNVEFKDNTNIRGSCQLLRGMDMEEEICMDEKPCIPLGLVCEDTSFSSQVSPHTSKDWRTAYKGYFRASQYRERVNSAFESYKTWGIGEDRFFVITDNTDVPTKSSRTLYFYLNAYNMPRCIGATLFDAETRQVTEYEFKYEEIRERESHMSPRTEWRKLVAERTFASAHAE